jgi:hypothetical protein
MSNFQEYTAGTDPTNRLSSLRVGSLTVAGGVSLRFAAAADHGYTVLYKNALGEANWLRLTDVAARSSNWTAIVSDPGAPRSRFYRLVTPPQP